MNRQLVFGTLGVLAVALAGCGGPPSSIAKTTGQITYQGSPVEGATITMAKEDNSMFATAITDAQGNFTMMTQVGQKRYEGAPIGPVTVSITKFKDMGNTGSYDPDGDPTAVDNMYSNMLAANSEDGMTIESENEIPGKYSAPQTSGLTETIEKDPTKNVFTYALED